MPLCPVGGFSFTTDVTAELRYRNFLPTGSASIPYYVSTPGYTYCYADLVPPQAAPSVSAILATTAVPNIQSNLYVDVMFLIGKIELRNPMNEAVDLGDTTYTTFETSPEQTTQNFYDFNGDGTSDHVEQGRVLLCREVGDANSESLDVFLSDATNSSNLSGTPGEVIDGYVCQDTHTAEKIKGSDKGQWQGVFYDGRQDDVKDFPDLVRLIDREFRDEEVGVLKSISQNDLRNTDVLVFRESTGQLILERRGLKPQEANYRRAVEYDEGQNQVAYRIMLRGRNDTNLNTGGGVNRRQSFEDWATEYQLSEPLRKRESDQPRPGEFIKVVAINRATGYIGTARVQLKSAAQGSSNMLDVEAPVITLLPPNLKIWAERDYNVEEGLTKGEERSYTIGNDGASLTSDTSIRIYTEWLDEDGRLLPDELGENLGRQYGLTGRLSKVVGVNQLRGTAIGDDMSEFAIAPGRNTQVLKLKGQASTTEHFYIHVIGKPKDQECVVGANCPSFDTINEQTELAGRPKLLTPFLTPLWDENQSWKEYRAYRETLRQLQAGNPQGGELAEEDKPNKPLPSYAWRYRPEYKFGQFDFEVSGIEIATTDDQVVDILNVDSTTINSNDDYINALYSLISNEFGALLPIDGSSELVLALGEDEQRITFGQDRSIRFSNLDGLSGLDVEDLVSMRLYTNNDGGNILWEYAFESSNIAKLAEADNQCNFSFNKNQYKDDGDIADIDEDNIETKLLLAYEPEQSVNKVSLVLEGVVIDKSMGITVKHVNGRWIDSELRRNLSSKEWLLSFELINSDEGEFYELYLYSDENGNSKFDNGEPTKLASYANEKQLRVLAFTREAYEASASHSLTWVKRITPSGESGEQLYNLFLQNDEIVPADANVTSLNVTYTENAETFGPDENTPKYANLVRAWSHGAGAIFDTKCAADITVYQHEDGSELHLKVLDDDTLSEKLEALTELSKFKDRLQAAVDNDETCPDDPDLYCFSLGFNDVDIQFSEYSIPGFDAADLAAAIGSAKLEVEFDVRADSNFFGLFGYDLEMNATGEIFDFYDFNYGKTTFGLGFNDGGAVLQVGFEPLREKGKVFITEVPFELKLEL